jgi:hypothetical protein
MFTSRFKVVLLIVVITIEFLILSTNLSVSPTSSLDLINLEDPHSLETNILMIDYSNDSFFLNGIINKLPNYILIKNGIQNLNYSMKYNFIYPDASFITNFTNFILKKSNPDSQTVDINQTALQYQSENKTVQNIFNPRNGTAINGLAVEEYLWINGQPFKSENTSYQIFLLNLSFINDKIYWFNIPEPDEVTNKQRHEWRLEWDYPPFDSINNFNAEFPYPGYSSKYPIYFLDPSAFNWYLNWTRIWREVPNDENHRHYVNSFAGYVQKIGDFSNSTNIFLSGSFIGNWLSEIVKNLFIIDPLSEISSPSSLTLQIAVLTDETDSNPYPDLYWTINKYLVKEELQKVIPKSIITIETNFFNISDHQSVKNLLNDPENIQDITPKPINNYVYYKGNELYPQFLNLDSEFFSQSNSEQTLRAYILILDNASFAGANWVGGGLFTGLGGGGRLLILNEVDRLFYNRTTTPIQKMSLSKVLIHEAGHAIGLPHPFGEKNSKNPSTYASDFISDVMGYYPSTANFSFLMVNNFQRLSLEPKIELLLENLNPFLHTDLAKDFLYNIITIYYQFLDYYHKLDFENAEAKLNLLQSLLNSKVKTESGGPKPPLFISYPDNKVVFLDSTISFSWDIYDLNPWKYIILNNGTVSEEGFWNDTSRIEFTFKPSLEGSYNISLIVFDLYGLSSMKSAFVFVQNIQSVSTSQSKNDKNTSLDSTFAFFLPLLIMGLFYKRKRS